MEGVAEMRWDMALVVDKEAKEWDMDEAEGGDATELYGIWLPLDNPGLRFPVGW